MIIVKTIIKNKLWVSSVLAFIAILIIPFVLSFVQSSSLSMPQGAYVKSGNRIFYNFLEKVKQNNGILVLGTSETGNSLNGNNYHSFLNKDKGFNRSLYSFGGAGRCSNVYFPLILDNPKAFSELEIIYYINPTYWRQGLSKFHSNYFNRYVDSTLVYAVKEKAQRLKVYDQFMKDGVTERNYLPFLITRIIDNFKSFYYHDLDKLFKKNNVVYPVKIDINNHYDKQQIERFKEDINLEYNAFQWFVNTNSAFPIIDTTTTYQYDMLRAFIQLVKEYNINCKFYLGPYNKIYCNKKSPTLKKEYQDVITNIKTILTINDVDFIDGSIFSNTPGTFIDIQHISEYGAYLTALQIKEFYEKNN
tara:strand:- start:1376 stop:2458 length:1083 start_codon:yes stop_codon:yes gene_type:complete